MFESVPECLRAHFEKLKELAKSFDEWLSNVVQEWHTEAIFSSVKQASLAGHGSLYDHGDRGVRRACGSVLALF